jgi:hypothetical protein
LTGLLFKEHGKRAAVIFQQENAVYILTKRPKMKNDLTAKVKSEINWIYRFWAVATA